MSVSGFLVLILLSQRPLRQNRGIGIAHLSSPLSWTHLLTLFCLKPSSVLPQQTDSPVLAHHIRNDTSLASFTISNGTKHVFFQEWSGVIRELIYEEGQWTALVGYVIATGRDSTPLAAVYIPAVSSTIPEKVTVNYLRRLYTKTDGTW